MRRFSLAAVAALILVVGGSAAHADVGGEVQHAQADDGLDRLIDGSVHPGLDGQFVPGRPVPVRIDLSATRLLGGELEVRLGGPSVETVDFEISADTSETHWVLLDGPPGDVIDVRAAVHVDGKTRNLDPDVVRWDGDAHLLGTLPGAGLGGPPAEDATTALVHQTIRVVELEPGLLDLGPGALAALDSVATTAEELSALPAAHRRAVLGWLADGGTLYVDSGDAPIEDWPDEYQPELGTTRIGPATVIAGDGELAAGSWDSVVLPAANRSIHEDGEAAANIPWGDVQSELFNVDLGRDLPGLAGLLAVLGIYILVVGPATYLVLRGRAMARWVAVPVLAVLATGVVFVNGDGLRSDTTAATIDIVEFGPGTATATSRILLATERGQREISAPRGWTAEFDDSIGGFGDVTQRRHADGVAFSVPAPPGGVGYLGASGPIDIDGALEVSATAVDDGTVTGIVRNTLDVTIDEVAVFAGRSASVGVGTLEPGGEASFELTGTSQFRFAADPFLDHWGMGVNGGFGWGPGVGPATTIAMPMPDFPRGPVPPDFGEIVSVECDGSGSCMQCDAAGNCFEEMMPCDEFGNCPPAAFGPAQACDEMGRCGSPLARPATLTATLRDRGTNAMASGMITAVGWTAELGPVLDLGDAVQVSESRTAVVARAFPGLDGDRLVDAAAVRTLLTSASPNNEGLVELVFRFDLPSGAVTNPDRLRLDVPEHFVHTAILTPSGDVIARDPESRVAGRAVVSVPADAVVRDHLFVRGSIPFEPPPPGREMVLYETSGP